MTHTPPVTEPTIEPNPETILQRIAVPLFSFSFVLFGALLASQTFLLPRLTTFAVGDLTLSVDEAIVYERTLRADVRALEDERTRLVLPSIDETHAALMENKRHTPSILDVRRSVEAAMRETAAVEHADVFIDALLLETTARTATVRGRIEDDQPGTMAILAAAVEAVRRLPEVRDLDPPALTRAQLPDGTYRSSFTFAFTLP